MGDEKEKTESSTKSSKDKTVEDPPSSSHASTQFNVPFEKLLGEENWPDWRMLMELYLGDLFTCTQKDPDPSVLADRQCIEFKNDFTARQKISFGVDKSLLKYLRGATTAHQAWSRLCNAFEDKGVFRRAALLRRLVSLKQESTLAQYVLDFKEVVTQIADTGKAIEDELCSVLLLENVKPIHKPFCQIVERTCQSKLPDGSPTLEFNIISEELLREGNKIKSQEISTTQSANAALKISRAPTKSGKSRDGSWQHGRGGVKPPSGSNNRYYKTNQNKQDHLKSGRNGSNEHQGKYPPCVHCSKTNHPERKCHFRFVSAATQRAKAAETAGSRKRKHSDSDDENTPKKKKPDEPKGPPKWVLKIAKRGQTNRAKNASAASGSSSSSVSDPDIAAQIDEIDEIVNKSSNKILKTYLDSGAFAPMSPEISCFHNYRPIHNEPIECAGDQVLYTQGTGTLVLNNNIDGLKEIQNFTYVPGLTSTLLSISAITKNDLVVVFKAKKCGIFKPDAVEINKPPLLETNETNGTYCLDLDVKINNKALKVARESQAALWHKRLGHISNDYLRQMHNSLVKGMDQINFNDLTLCEVCQMAKSKQSSFPKDGAHRKENILDLIHTDVCEITDTPSLEGYRYFVTFIDDYSRYTMIGLLKTKDEVLNKFKDYRTLVQNQTGKTIKAIRSDNGKEYINKTFFDYLKSEGIMRQHSTPYCPQQNGVSERANRTLQEKVRALLKTAGLSWKYWPEALQTAVFLKNLSPTKALADMVPYEAWTGEKPDISHIRVFGCCAYAHIRKEKAKKLGDRSRTCILVGYDDERKSYLLLDPAEPTKIFTERSVVFDETVFPAVKMPQANLEQPNQAPPPSLCDQYFSLHKDSLCQEAAGPSTTDTLSHTVTDPEINSTNTHMMPDKSLDNSIPNFWNETSLSSTIDSHGSSENMAGPGQDSPPVTDNIIPSITVPPALESIGKRKRTPKQFPDHIVYGLSKNKHKIPDRACLVIPTDSDIPQSVEDVHQSPDMDQWVQAMGEELDSFAANKVWSLEDLPTGAKVIGNKWVFKKKLNMDGTTLFRARLVAKGFTQTYGLDYHETFAPVVRGSTLRLLLATAVTFDLKICHIDIKTAFLYGDLEETVFMAQPEGFIAEGQKNKVCRLYKTVYGLKQAARNWNNKADQVLKGLGYRNLRDEPCIYIKETKASIIIIALYVDDFYVFFNSEHDKTDLVMSLEKHFIVKDLGEAKSCLGMTIERDASKGTLTLHQASYIHDTLEKFRMTDCNPKNTPMETKIKPHLLSQGKPTNAPYQELIGRLIYLSISTRPDIAFTASYLSQFNVNHTSAHWELAKKVLKYLKQTASVGLTFTKSQQPTFCIIGYVDADFAENSPDYKSYSGYCFCLDGNVISWESRKQKLTAQSSTESEYIAMAEAAKESTYLNELINEIFHCGLQRVTLFSDSLSAIKLAYSDKYSARTKHFGVRIQMVRDSISDGSLALEHLPSTLMPADFLTKALGKDSHYRCMETLKIRCSV